MADTTALKNRIRAAIKSNDNQEITGPVLQQALLDMVDELNGATETEANARQSGDDTLQQNITTEKNRAEGAESTLEGAINQEGVLRSNADSALQAAIDLINSYIPAQASSSNQLADKDFVNSSIATATATFRGSYNVVTDLGLSYNATHAQIQTALATKMSALSITPDNNDYAFVQIPTADATPTQIAKTEKYKYNGSAWAFEYELNNSGFTAAQWAAINSGATLELIGKLSALPTNAELTELLAAKQNVIQDLATIRSGASAGAMAVQPATLDSALSNTVAESGVFDLSAYNDGTTYADLNAALTALNALPADFKKGGMSFKFVQSSDNKYVQFRLTHPLDNVSTAAADFANTANWQGVDDEPIFGSVNLVKSGGVYDATNITTLYPNINADTIYGLEYKRYLGNCYYTPERNIRKITGFTIYARENFYPTDTLKIVAYKVNDIVVLKELSIIGGINRFNFETPITCDEEHELAIYLTNRTDYSSYELGKYDGGTFYVGETNGLVLNSTWTSAFANSILKMQFIKSEGIRDIKEEVEDVKEEVEQTKESVNSIESYLQRIDDEPTKGSVNLVKSGGVYDATNITTLYPNINADTIYGLEYKRYLGNCYYTPERNIRKITGFTIYARENFYPTDTLKIVAYKVNDVVVLKELSITGGINKFTFETPITCDEEHELAVYLTSNNISLSYELGNLNGGAFYISDGGELILNSVYSASFANSILKMQFIKIEGIRDIKEEVEQTKESINSLDINKADNSDIEELEQQIKKTDYYYGKVIGFIGDSYADSGTIALGLTSICKELYPNYFSKIHPDAIIDDRAVSGAKISGTQYEYGGTIAQKANSFVTNYPMQTSELPYPINTTDNVTTKSGYFIFKDFSKINGLFFNIDWNRYVAAGDYRNRGWVYVYIYSYNTTTHVFTQLKEVHPFMGDSSDHQNGCVCVYFDDAVEALSGECIAVRFRQYIDLTTVGQHEWVDTYINVVEDTNYTYVLDDLNHSGEQEYQGVPLIQLMVQSNLECLVMQGGLNDYYTNTPLGQLTDNVNKNQVFDKTTFYGALEKMFCNINYNLPFVRKGFIIMPQEMTDPSAADGWGNYVIAIKNTCKKWGIRYLDLNDMFATYCKNFGRTTNNGTSFNDYPLWGIEPDGRYNGHPEVLFARQMNRYIASFIESL